MQRRPIIKRAALFLFMLFSSSLIFAAKSYSSSLVVNQNSELQFISAESYIAQLAIFNIDNREYQCFVRRSVLNGTDKEHLIAKNDFHIKDNFFDLNKINQTKLPGTDQWELYSKVRRDFLDEKRKQDATFDQTLVTLDRQQSACEKVSPEHCTTYENKKKALIDKLIAEQFGAWEKRILSTPSFVIKFESKESSIHKIECARTESILIQEKDELKLLAQIKADEKAIFNKLGFNLKKLVSSESSMDKFSISLSCISIIL